MPKEQYMCQLCANHGLFNQPKKGHKQKCPFKGCPCEMCTLNLKRRALDQIERQLRQFAEEEVATNNTSKYDCNATSDRTVTLPSYEANCSNTKKSIKIDGRSIFCSVDLLVNNKIRIEKITQ